MQKRTGPRGLPWPARVTWEERRHATKHECVDFNPCFRGSSYHRALNWGGEANVGKLATLPQLSREATWTNRAL